MLRLTIRISRKVIQNLHYLFSSDPVHQLDHSTLPILDCILPYSTRDMDYRHVELLAQPVSYTSAHHA